MCPGDPPVPQVFHDLGGLARVVELAAELAEGRGLGGGLVVVLPPKVGEVLSLVGHEILKQHRAFERLISWLTCSNKGQTVALLHYKFENVGLRSRDVKKGW